MLYYVVVKNTVPETLEWALLSQLNRDRPLFDEIVFFVGSTLSGSDQLYLADFAEMAAMCRQFGVPFALCRNWPVTSMMVPDDLIGQRGIDFMRSAVWQLKMDRKRVGAIRVWLDIEPYPKGPVRDWFLKGNEFWKAGVKEAENYNANMRDTLAAFDGSFVDYVTPAGAYGPLHPYQQIAEAIGVRRVAQGPTHYDRPADKAPYMFTAGMLYTNVTAIAEVIGPPLHTPERFLEKALDPNLPYLPVCHPNESNTLATMRALHLAADRRLRGVA